MFVTSKLGFYFTVKYQVYVLKEVTEIRACLSLGAFAPSVRPCKASTLSHGNVK